MAVCKACGQTIYWAHTQTGKAMPLDGPDPKGNVWVIRRDDGSLRVVEQEEPGARLAMPHWATCPEADSFRGAR